MNEEERMRARGTGWDPFVTGGVCLAAMQQDGKNKELSNQTHRATRRGHGHGTSERTNAIDMFVDIR